jgi:hypothetical protein
MARQTTKRAEWARWLAAQGHDLAGLTGTDVHVLAAITACWELAGIVGLDRVWPIVQVGLLPLMQAKYHALAIELVARSLDWSDRDRLRLLSKSSHPVVVLGDRLAEASSILAMFVTQQRVCAAGCGGIDHASKHGPDCPLFLAWQFQARASYEANAAEVPERKS